MSLINFIDDYVDYYGLTKTENKYFYKGIPVPRTTEILSSMLHEEYLMEWSNYLGRYQRKDYNEYLETAATIGTHVHKCIEDYIKYNIEHQPQEFPLTISDRIINAFNSFKKWWIELNEDHKVKVLFQEKELVCDFFGGTLDLLLEINGLIYLVDFKSSNRLSYKYFLQLSSYEYMLRKEEGIKIDGCNILMLNKKRVSYQEFILNFKDISHRSFMDQCQSAFLSLVQAYLQRLCVEQNYTKLFGGN